jgi:hypothetical protein
MILCALEFPAQSAQRVNKSAPESSNVRYQIVTEQQFWIPAGLEKGPITESVLVNIIEIRIHYVGFRFSSDLKGDLI